MNPLFSSNNPKNDDEPDHKDPGYVLPRQKGGKITPLHSHEELRESEPKNNSAVTLIRSKIDNLYVTEPNAGQELREVEREPVRTKHQQFMHDLSVSGKSLADIQVAWHTYYSGLSDHEKHEVWQEFYAANSRQPSAYTQFVEQRRIHEPAHAQESAQGTEPHLGATHATQAITYAGAETPGGSQLPQIIAPGSAGLTSAARNNVAEAHAGLDAQNIDSLTPAEALLARYEGRLNTDSSTAKPPHQSAAKAIRARSRNPVFAEQLAAGVNPNTDKKGEANAAAPATLPPAIPHKSTRDKRSVEAIRKQVKSRVRAANDRVPAAAKQQAKSLFFGLSMGGLVLLVFLFGFFNEVIIAPFIQPSRHASATPIILSSQDIAANATPEVIIPKINVEIPVDYSQTSSNESQIEDALENGVVHYPTTVQPGQIGNAAFFGHSSNNIFNPGKYKFAFVLLHTLVPGDIFYLTNNQKVYTYKVYDKKIVPPSDVSVLNNVDGKTATATLITCDPPGTSLNRLVVWGEQISPDPTGNSDSSTTTTTTTAATQPTALAGNGPTLWGRLTGWIKNL